MRKMMIAATTFGMLLLVQAAVPLTASHRDVLRFTVEVAEDFTKFVSTPVNPADTEPKRGAWFLTEGRIFPNGTIQGDGSSFDPNTPGALGTWICRGTHLVSLTDILNGAPVWVTTHQLYLLPDHQRSIATDGLEGSEPFTRAVTGGTGRYAAVVGEQRQEFLGLNTTQGVNLRVTFTLRRVDD